MTLDEVQPFIDGLLASTKEANCFGNQKVLAYELFALEKALKASIADNSPLHRSTHESLLQCVINTSKLNLSLRPKLGDLCVIGTRCLTDNTTIATLKLTAAGMARALNRANAGFVIEALKIVTQDEEIFWNGSTQESIGDEPYTLPSTSLKGKCVLGAVTVIAYKDTRMVFSLSADEIQDLAQRSDAGLLAIDAEFILLHTLKRAIKNLVTTNTTVLRLIEIVGAIDEELFVYKPQNIIHETMEQSIARHETNRKQSDLKG
ncbi:hypothetical protein [Photobacterium damselae]|uniref:hypothetical protein n=1 Tax=Photobacterium damselae TaxID=38293 RepID=UPI000D663AAC|nr:hypothetical protein [Photobacterium damselae]AWK84512.1 hypothetical protein BST98_20990 [Photobacterium damselae]